MKRRTAIFLVILLSLTAVFTACGDPVQPEKTLDDLVYDEEYEMIYNAADFDSQKQFVHGTLEREGYYSMATQSDANGDIWNEHIVFKTGAVSLTEGIYRFTVETGMDIGYIEAAGDQQILQLRVFEDKTNEVLGLKEIYWSDYPEKEVMYTQSFDFVLWDKADVRLEVRFIDYSTLYLKTCKLEAVSKAEYQPASQLTLFQETAADQKLTYDSSALYYFDMQSFLNRTKDSVFGYDTALMLFCLQGLVNRDGQHLYMAFTPDSWRGSEVDSFWLSYLTENTALSGKNVVKVETPAALLRLFQSFYKGFVLWDSKVSATENVACTVCGVEGYLPLRKLTLTGSLYELLTEEYNIEVRMDLSGKFTDGKTGNTTVDGISFTATGSAKNDAYLWAKAKYLDTHQTNQTIIAYHLDAYTWDKTGLAPSYIQLNNCMLSNKDYYIQQKCFFFDLSPESYLPNDDPMQNEGEDQNTFKLILKAQNEYADGSLTTFGGFCPWYLKYTKEAPNQPSNSRIATQVEWSLAQMLGEYYLVKDADAFGYTYLTNASVFSALYDGTETYQQGLDENGNKKNKDSAIAQRAAKYIENGKVKPGNYVCIYMGDYDAGAWINLSMPSNFSAESNAVKKYPLAWPVNTTGISRVPQVVEFMYDNATVYDYFVGDHNGYGYIDLEFIGKNASLNGDLDSFFAETKQIWERYDLDLMGFLINTTGNLLNNQDIMTRMADLAPYGIATNNLGLDRTGAYVEDSQGNAVGLSNVCDASNSQTMTTAMLTQLIDEPDQAYFMTFRHILATIPYITEQLDNLVANTSYGIQIVDPYVYFYLMTYGK